jgi:hypothetical protein
MVKSRYKDFILDIEGYCIIYYRERIMVPTIPVDDLLKALNVKKSQCA